MSLLPAGDGDRFGYEAVLVIELDRLSLSLCLSLYIYMYIMTQPDDRTGEYYIGRSQPDNESQSYTESPTPPSDYRPIPLMTP